MYLYRISRIRLFARGQNKVLTFLLLLPKKKKKKYGKDKYVFGRVGGNA